MDDDFFTPQAGEDIHAFDSAEPATTIEPIQPVVDPLESTHVVPETKPGTEQPIIPSTETPAPDDSLPKKLPDEPEWRYNLRKQILEGGKEKAAAETPEERLQAQQKVEGARRELAKRSRENPIPQVTPQEDDILNEYSSKEDLEADRKRVEALGNGKFVSREDLRNEFRQIEREEREISQRNKALDDFFTENAKIYNNEESKDLIFNVIEKYFQYEGKSYDEFRFMLNSAHQALHPDNFEEKLAKSEALKSTLKSSQFDGGTSSTHIQQPNKANEALKKTYLEQSGEDVSWLIDD